MYIKINQLMQASKILNDFIININNKELTIESVFIRFCIFFDLIFITTLITY